MADKKWLGTAQGRKQVSTVTIGGTWATGETVTLTINLKDLTVTVGAATGVNDVAAALKAAWEADAAVGTETRNTTGTLIPEFSRITATVASAVVTLTADDDGVPFTVTGTETSTSGTVTVATPTTATGPENYADAENWSPTGVPATGDNIYLENCETSIRYGLDQSAVTPGSVVQRSTMTGEIGLPAINATGGYGEYRDRYLKFAGVTGGYTLEDGDGAGSGRVNIDFGSTAVTINCNKTGSASDTGMPALLVKGSHASNVLNATKGHIGLAVGVGETARFDVIRVGSQGSPSSDVKLLCGAGCTLAAISQAGGEIRVNSNVTALVQTGGTYYQHAGLLGALTTDGGTNHLMSTGTITSIVARGRNAVVDRSRDLRPVTITNASFTGGAAFLDPSEVTVWSNPFAFDKESLAASDIGTVFTLARA